ncbi:1-phosphatidylinositol 4-kinase [Saccharomycopsis crataegensis]|uniref:1-phosphatidylinositol 4-kinase n=1 Tax=Saccharomycopsis crataegensis TaxID=43959 RepID=A0AAV5QG88_9ASCO|nr:1-phosphatidylinositol 4-kinase [Saccharomycopsis crataegensis]
MEDLEANTLLLKLSESPSFSMALCVSNLIQHANNIGVFAYLCERIKSFKYDDVEFYVPQLCQILVTVETESMALEDLLIDLSSQYPHFTLLTFWQLQAHLADLSDDPECYGFQVARRVLNSLQYFLFNSGSPSKKFRENTHPAVILSSAIAGSFGLPSMGQHIAPLAISQGKKQRSFVFQLAKNYTSQLAKNLTAKNTKLNSRRDPTATSVSNDPSGSKYDTIASPAIGDKGFKKEHPREYEVEGADNIKSFEKIMNNTDILAKKKSFNKSSKLTANALKLYPTSNATVNNIEDFDLSASRLNFNANPNSVSLPDFRDTVSEGGASLRSEGNSIPSSPSSSNGLNGGSQVSSVGNNRTRANSLGRGRSAIRTHHHHHHHPSKRTISPSLMTTTTRIKLLKNNYFKCETQFAIALQQISMRLSQVPKEARLTTLKAELSLLNRDLPAEVDIPTLLPPSKKLKLHKLVRITPNEAAVLNSAEKVPFLLLIEYLSDEVDFDPASDNNMKLLRERADKKYIFDMGTQTATRLASAKEDQYGLASPNSPIPDAPSTPQMMIYDEQNMDEEDLGDLSVVKLSNKNSETENLKQKMYINSVSVIPNLDETPIDEENSSNTRRGSNLNFSSKYSHMTPNLDGESATDDKVEPEDLATHMRIAAVMLTQLDNPTNTLPSDQSGAIKARIIESMQSLQDNFGYNDIQMVKGQAGDRKLENDLKLGGFQNNNETTYLGEDWETKRDRIRKESPFGHHDNWELCSVISKTGDDLRQEAFACQIIQAMSQIWKQENIGVWVKKMRILITSANTGLVETITNALSVHSIKKALTKITIEEGTNPKGTIESLSLHFKKVFGDEDSIKYKNAQNNFAASLASYSLICYLLQIKDRHNGNIMLDNEGHIIHIDFGFLLSNSPGSVGFEAAPFKLTLEYIEILGGVDGECYHKFKTLLKQAFIAVRKHAEHIIQMVELMQRESTLPCFKAGDQTANQLRQRFQLHLTDGECEEFVENFLIQKSNGSLYTRLYDQFQLLTQGIYS